MRPRLVACKRIEATAARNGTEPYHNFLYKALIG